MKPTRHQANKGHLPGIDPGGESQRTARVGASIQRALQTSLARGLSDPRIRGLVSVVAVHMTPDLATARVYISVVPEQYEPTVLRGLCSAASRLRGDLNTHLRLRRIPKLIFEIDRSLKKQAELESLVQLDGDAELEYDEPLNDDTSPDSGE
jgi:ribosome-binding factor A